MMIKKFVVMGAIVLSFLFIIGCLDYKAYDLQDEKDSDSLVNEIAEIERELGLDENASDDASDRIEEIEEIEENGDLVVEEEVVLPELDEEELLAEEVQVITVNENELVKLNVKVVDPDEDIVSYAFGKPLDQTGSWQTSYGDAGEYVVTITATDGVLTTEKNVKIVVQRVNVPPVISPLVDMTVEEGELVEFEPKISDPNNDPVTVKISEPLKDGAFETDHTSAGSYQVRVDATDGELASEAVFTLTVLDVNVLPEVSGVEDLTVKEGETVTITPVVTDLDEDELTVTISDPVGDDGVWATNFTDHGEYFITVKVSDGKDTVTKRARLLIEDVNMPPEIVEVTLKIN